MWPAWGYTAEAAAAASPLPLVLRCLAQALATGFHRFLARFSGRRRYRYRYHRKYPPPWAFLVLVLTSSLFSIVDACSSRTTPKPRPPAPTARPNITFHTYECPPAYAAWYCLNGATCFTVKIGDSLLYNCECADGYMGPRCEYKDLDGSYLPSQRRFMLETASIAGGATIAVFLVVILCVVMYLHYKRRTKSTRTLVGGSSTSGSDYVDGSGSLRPSIRTSHMNAPTFGTRWRTERYTQMPSSQQSTATTQGSEWLRQPSSAATLHQVAAGGDSSGLTKDMSGGLGWNTQQRQTQTSQQQQRYNTPGHVVQQQNQPRHQQPQQVLITSTNRDVYSA